MSKKAVQYDNERKMHEVADKLDKGLIPLSQDGGNLIRMREDGLYYGIEAAPELRYLYVDATHGKDQNPFNVKGAGTRENPLRTFRYALSLGQEGTRRIIYLHDSQVHNITVDESIAPKSGSIEIIPYGDALEQAENEENGDWISALNRLGKKFKQPVIKFSGVQNLLYPSSTKEKAAFATGILSLHKVSLMLHGIELKNDLDFRLDSQGKNSIHNSNFHRIWCQDSSIKLSNCNISAVGTVEKDSVYSSQLYQEGLNPFGFFFLQNTSLKIDKIPNDISNLGCAIVAYKGWNTPLDSASSVNIEIAGQQKEITKRCYGQLLKKLRSGDHVLIKPQSDVDPDVWVNE